MTHKELHIEAHFSGHETFPLRQMWLKKAFEQAETNSIISKETFSDDGAIATFGVGRNMVSSIKHWALACEVMREDESKKYFVLDEIARKIYADGGYDPYAEYPTTAWYAHWCLAGRGSRSTTWFWLFNVLNAQTFTRDEIMPTLAKFAQSISGGRKLSQATLARDLETCVRGYAPRSTSNSVEEAAEPMLAELGLLQEERKGVYSFRRGPKSSLTDAFFAWALVDFWDRYYLGETSLTFEAVAYGLGSPGRVFKLDEESTAERLFGLSALTDGKLKWSDTAGLRQIYRSDFDAKAFARVMMKRSYE
ncbi:DUF4007 family protein [Noviherbaspirillum soli]|uniref:DUF4007 family protein n=1 Tax=Noviherbaspirillum soli TaxID=1064518 RepID=UPI00188B8A20|nr:DUF4007 family protein [Noviherbaspirillum soli]